MAVIGTFRALRFRESAGQLEALLAPPLPDFGASRAAEYSVRSPYNTIHLSQPEGQSEDRSKYIRYARSAARLMEWRREGILAPDSDPAVYRIVHTYHRDGQTIERLGLIALVKHQEIQFTQGFSVPAREDSLRLLEATQTHLDLPAVMADTDAAEFTRLIASAPCGTAVKSESEEGAVRLQPITDEETLNALRATLAGASLFCLSGRARIEAAKAFRETLGEREGEVPQDFVPVAIFPADASLGYRGLSWIVHRLPMPPREAVAIIGNVFPIEAHHSTQVQRLLEEYGREGRPVIGMAIEGGEGYLVFLDDAKEKSLPFALQREIVPLLGLDKNAPISYTHLHVEAARATNQGAAIAFLSPDPNLSDVLEAARQGEVLPNGGGILCPQVPSGLLFWSLRDSS